MPTSGMRLVGKVTICCNAGYAYSLRNSFPTRRELAVKLPRDREPGRGAGAIIDHLSDRQPKNLYLSYIAAFRENTIGSDPAVAGSLGLMRLGPRAVAVHPVRDIGHGAS